MNKDVVLNLALPEEYHAEIRERAAQHKIHESAILKAFCAKALEEMESLPDVVPNENMDELRGTDDQQDSLPAISIKR